MDLFFVVRSSRCCWLSGSISLATWQVNDAGRYLLYLDRLLSLYVDQRYAGIFPVLRDYLCVRIGLRIFPRWGWGSGRLFFFSDINTDGIRIISIVGLGFDESFFYVFWDVSAHMLVKGYWLVWHMDLYYNVKFVDILLRAYEHWRVTYAWLVHSWSI